MCIITYSTFIVDQIYPKFDTGISLYTPNTCVKFQPVHTWVIAIFARCVQWQRRKRRKIFMTHISTMAWGILFKFGIWPSVHRNLLHCKCGTIWRKCHRVTDMWKLRLCCSCQLTLCLRMPRFWAERHTTVCLDFSTMQQKPTNRVVPEASDNSNC